MKIRFEFPFTTPREEIIEAYMDERHCCYKHYDEAEKKAADAERAKAEEKVDEMYAWFKAIAKAIEETT